MLGEGVGVGVAGGVGVGDAHKCGLIEHDSRAGDFSIATAATSPIGLSLWVL